MSGGYTQRASQWVYRGLWAALVRWFRIPPQPPTLPVAPGDRIVSFRPSEGYLRYLKFLFWLFAVVLLDGMGMIAFLIAVMVLMANGLWWIALLITPPALAILIVPDIFAYVAIHLKYDTTWYVLTDRSIRIRRGIWIIHEMTITFENVQNVTVNQGPLQRWFGIGQVVISTAGGGSGGSPAHGGGGGIGHRGVIEGVDNAPEIRDLILARVRASTSAGLGDEPHHHESASRRREWAAEHLAALAAIRDEVRLMHAATAR
jgi:membrane protein YdbS with pleckstrin-like domain